MSKVGGGTGSADFQRDESWPGSPGNPLLDPRNAFGVCSIEDYTMGSLRHTHADAEGFLSWLERHGATQNFWLKDRGVLAREYLRDTDNRDGIYGIDAGRIFYHSGHGRMDDEGVFFLPMGFGWNDRFVAKSTEMYVGDGNCRYLFWSTCQSLRVSDGHTPRRTWGTANQGARMIFGFETTTVDSPDYGRYFGLFRDAGHSFATAWLKAGLAVSETHIPTVAAWGASADEAQALLNGERYFSDVRANPGHVAWCSASPGTQHRQPHRRMPEQVAMARLTAVADRSIQGIFGQFSFDSSGVRERNSEHGFVARDGERLLTMHADGAVNVRLSALDHLNRCDMSAHEAHAVAQAATQEYRLGHAEPLVLDRVIPIMSGSAATDRPDQPAEQWRSGFLVRYRQVIDGVPVLTPRAGTVDLVVGNAGSVVSITDAVRPVETLQEDTTYTSAGTGAGHPEDVLGDAIAQLVRDASPGEEPSVTAHPVSGTAEYGYEVEGGHARLIAHCLVELDYGDGCRKRHRVQAPALR